MITLINIKKQKVANICENNDIFIILNENLGISLNLPLLDNNIYKMSVQKRIAEKFFFILKTVCTFTFYKFKINYKEEITVKGTNKCSQSFMSLLGANFNINIEHSWKHFRIIFKDHPQ